MVLASTHKGVNPDAQEFINDVVYLTGDGVGTIAVWVDGNVFVVTALEDKTVSANHRTASSMTVWITPVRAGR